MRLQTIPVLLCLTACSSPPKPAVDICEPSRASAVARSYPQLQSLLETQGRALDSLQARLKDQAKTDAARFDKDKDVDGVLLRDGLRAERVDALLESQREEWMRQCKAVTSPVVRSP